ncbi:DNA polymerase-3 subunit epsilon [Sanguibacter gelidistatuariae]|uniref:DNA polymerase-3 subunit epsilon n=1 Tax=Sanguibacter gelidistatuariae TaxID=1814289 RepID=A0A1G6HB42_9MICO|nr:TerD family protein [Sanguibacter gelidistatuariae]SDB91509.1 DNA polymerase-3 subunit epsilon [Sanguibacter gelidistatuariae]
MIVGTSQGMIPASMSSRYRQGYAVVDVETSGLSPASHRVLQVAISQIAPDGSSERTWSTLLDPGCNPGPVHIHGLTRERLAGSPQYADVAAEVADLVDGRILVAHNAQFDWNFLAAEANRGNAPLTVDSRLCTMALTRRLDLPLPNLKLESVAAYWGVPQLAAHDAVDDTRVLVEVLRHSLVAADRLGLALPLTPCDGPPPVVYPAAPARPPCRWVYAGRWTPSTPLVQGMKVVFTGETRIPRETLTARAAAAGLDVMSSASSRTSVVVCPDPGYRTRKLEAARSHGTPVVSEEEFLRLLAQVAPGTDKSAASSRATISRCPTPADTVSQVPSPQEGVPSLVAPSRVASPHVAPPSAAPVRRGPLTGHRVLVLGGPHTDAAALRTRVGLAGGQAAANFTSSVTDIVALDGADADPRWHRGRAVGLQFLVPETLLPVPSPAQAAGATGLGEAESWPAEGALGTARAGIAAAVPEPVVLPRGGVVDLPSGDSWSLGVCWADGAATYPDDVAEVDVVAFVTDDGEEVGGDDDFVFFNAPTHRSGAVALELDLPGEVLVTIRPEALPAATRRVIVAATVADGKAFGDIGPIELTLRDDDGATLARATLDAATEEQSLIIATLYQRGDRWRFRAVGQGYASGLASLAVRHGVDIDED